MRREEKKKNSILPIIVILILIAGVICAYLLKTGKINFNHNVEEVLSDNQEQIEYEKNSENDKEKKKKIQIFNGNDRTFAVMIDNNVNAQPHSGINRAYMVYEIIVEGGETRLMALFKGIDTSKNDVAIGPIRSARHYFVDYAIESDAVYAHLGQSPKADEYITNLGVPDINGQIYDTGKARTSTSLYWRVSHKKSPHNAYTSLASLEKICEKQKLSTKSNKKSVLNYVEEEVTLDREDAVNAKNITIPYTSSHKVKYIYDEETKRYTRYSKGKKQTDEETGEDVTTKNIIITFIKNVTLNDGEDKGRQDLDNLGNQKGYYITNGKAIEITCSKEYIGDQTKYVDLEGNTIEVNDGNTWINICPIDANVILE